MSQIPPMETSKEPRVGSILVGDVEELKYTVAPWQLRMNQLSSGSLHASFSFAQMNNILLIREYWTKQISAYGLSPPGFIAFAAPCAGPKLSLCGSTITAGRLVCALDGQEIDFLTPESDDHWVMLLPTTLIKNYLGEEFVASMHTDSRVLLSDPQLISQLTSQALQTMAVLQATDESTRHPLLLDALEEQLLATVSRVLLNSHGIMINQKQATKRFIAYRRAREILETSQTHYPIEKLAKSLGVSRRSLETAFREEMMTSPQAFSRCIRLNGVHRELLHASPEKLKVTDALQAKGFTEWGRAAGYYSKLFCEPPSDTLRRESSRASMRLMDTLYE